MLLVAEKPGRGTRSSRPPERSPSSRLWLLTGWLLLAASVSSVQAQSASSAITRKLNSIIIPQIEFHATTIADAVEFLRQESQRLDPDPNPAARGVNILLNQPAAANTRITLTLTRLPLLEALKYVAAQAGLKVKVEPYVVSLVPLSDPSEPMVTAVFHVPPNMIPNASSVAGGSALDQPATAATH